MVKYLIADLKPLYAHIMKIQGFNEYLISKEFNFFCLERNLDEIWDGAISNVQRDSYVTVLIPEYTGEAQEAFEIFISILYKKNKSSFLIILAELLKDFQNSKNIKIDLSVFSKDLLKMGYLKKDTYIFINKASNKRKAEISSKPPEENTMPPKNTSRKIFIVHGHDNELKQHVARILEKIDLDPIILHEQPDSGNTVIEKIEHYSEEVQFAIILLTPDDEGRKKGIEIFETRARQNVILEYGYFIGKFGRKRVICLNKGVKDIPSDMNGLIYITVDENEAWKYDVGKNLKAAGYNVDLNKL